LHAETGNINGVKFQRLVRHLLKVLDHLHNDLHIIHNGINPTCLFRAVIKPMLDAIVEQELSTPCSRKFVNGHAIYQSRPIPRLHDEDEVLLGNFDRAELVDSLGGHHPDIIPSLNSYSAPEHITGDSYSYQSDIWALGCLLAELLGGDVLFPASNSQGEYTSRIHIEQIVQLLGSRYVPSNDAKEKFDLSSHHGKTELYCRSLERIVMESGFTRGDLLLKMLSDMLTCDPNFRKTAREILADEDSWINIEIRGKWWERIAE
jgi:serine/threonine protein kinase